MDIDDQRVPATSPVRVRDVGQGAVIQMAAGDLRSRFYIRGADAANDQVYVTDLCTGNTYMWRKDVCVDIMKNATLIIE